MPNLSRRILLITGPAGAGKSTVADDWAKTRDGRCAHLSLDAFRLLVKSGYHDPRPGWNDEAQRQLDIARSNVAAVVIGFVESGIDCVIDDAVFPNWEQAGIDRWKRALGDIEIDLVALLPQWPVIRDRNDARDDVDRLPRDMLRKIYDDMAGWREQTRVPVIDSSDLSVPETVAEIERLLVCQSTR
ncbi:MAG: AAA family ATPase [Dehalococcoidia bacterium]|nr:AAA family ATPase [Dehalococcoidia bacterium]